MSKIAACYLRVSTSEQHAEHQRPEVEALAQARGYTPQWFIETASGTQKDRPQFAAVMHAARSGKVSAVIVWSMDRLGRDMLQVTNAVLELRGLGVRVMSARESWLDTDGPVTELLIAIFAWVAQFENQRRRERQRSGVEAAKKRGVKFGRPRVSPTLLSLAVERVRRAPGAPLKRTAESVGVSERSLRRALAAAGIEHQSARRRTT